MDRANNPSNSPDRAASEIEAYSDGGFMDERGKHKSKLQHYYRTPNNARMQRVFEDLVESHISDNAVLEIGCGTGWNCKRVLDHGAAAVHGIDIAESMLKQARENFDDPRLKFSLHDIHQPLDGNYDLIIGRAVLHHVDYQHVLRQLFETNLNPGGHMFFIEPMAAGLLTKLYWKLSPHMHTPDERPFYTQDIRWLEQTFPGFKLIPFGYLSFPVNIASSIIMSQPSNIFTKVSDSIDQQLARIRFLGPRFHTGIFCIHKPAA